MKDYSRGEIYKIFKKNEPILCYVGSTIKGLSERLRLHKKDSKKRASLFYITVDEKWDEWEMELIEKYPCKTDEELRNREGIYIQDIGILNKQIPGRTGKQYYDDNKQTYLNTSKEWREHNKTYLEDYRKTNKEKIKEKSQEYREKHRDEINRKQQEKRALKKPQNN